MSPPGADSGAPDRACIEAGSASDSEAVRKPKCRQAGSLGSSVTVPARNPCPIACEDSSACSALSAMLRHCSRAGMID